MTKTEAVETLWLAWSVAQNEGFEGPPTFNECMITLGLQDEALAIESAPCARTVQLVVTGDGDDDDPYTVWGVFSTRDKAEETLKQAGMSESHRVAIQSWELDEWLVSNEESDATRRRQA